MDNQWRRVLSATLIFLFLALPSWAQATTSLQFLGAARTVGGSACLLETGKSRILIDFGSFMSPEDRFRNDLLPFDPSTIDYVLLTHAHSDHGGRIPLLYKNGFRGKVVGIGATKTLTRLLLGASLDYTDRETVALFGSQDIAAMMKNFMSLSYDRKIELSPDIAVRFRNAGHILGSAMIEIWCKDGERVIKIVFSGDMGNTSIPLLKAPFDIREGDFVIVEATYGTTQRTKNKTTQFGTDIGKTLQAGGSVLIPAFTLDRTQKVLFTLGRLKREGIIPDQTPVYADSGMARRITRIYGRYGGHFHPEARKLTDGGQDLFLFPGLHDVSGAEALRAHDLGKPAIYVTSSGMLDHGNAPQHLEKMIEDPRNLLAIVGWQAPGSLGSRLLVGEQRVRIPVRREGEGGVSAGSVEKDVKMRIMQFDLFSNHADACQVLNWLAGFGKTKHVFVIHGDKENTINMARMIDHNLGFRAVAPELNDRIFISADQQDRNLKAGAIPCVGLGGSEKQEEDMGF
ncbi:MAG: MBL fold metallo-hydrolase [Deltaproteobacteria bacterium]|nr:MBL fold metallo-hydrolase [Deltaproteobacteria bacterium]